MEMHESKGVKFVKNASVKKFVGNDQNEVTEAVLDNADSDSLKADVVVLGVGVTPTTRDYLNPDQIRLDSVGNVIVDKFMETSVKNVFAAGDIAKFPLTYADKTSDVSIGHWQIAQSHGRIVGLNLASEVKQPLKTVPFFWTVQYGKSIRYAGFAPDFDDIIYDGNVSDGAFVAYFCKNNTVEAVASLNRDPAAAAFANLKLDGKSLTKAEAVNTDSWMKANL